MNRIKNIFSISDLENLTGIKAHTIRIWEKRYGVLTPLRSDTNIRNYDLQNLQKLLNITLLNSYGYKISKIATYSDDKINSAVREIISEKSVKNHAINAFKMAMLSFDQTQFYNTYNSLLSEKSFKEVFFEIIIPFMSEVGLLWQAGTITESHEHFISYLIKQKLLINTEKIQILEPTKKEKVFILYLPENEIHELGLMYLNYEILLKGYKTIFLGESVPIQNLKNIKQYFDEIVFVSYMTVYPEKEFINKYVTEINAEILDSNTKIWFIGRMTQFIENQNINQNIKIFKAIDQLIEEI